MKKLFIYIASVLALLTACTMQNNPLLMESPLPYGAPQFDKISEEHYIPAFKQAIKEGKAEIDAIVNNREAPSFSNTIEALDYAGSALNKVGGIFYNLLEADANDTLQQIAEEISPLMTEYSMYVSLNEKLFERVKEVYSKRASLNLDPAQVKLLTDTYKSFERSGANLNDEDKKTYAAIEEELSLLTLQFQKNQLSSTNAFSMNLHDEAELAGLPDFVKDMAAQAAKDKGTDGWLFDLSAPSYGGFMKYSARRDLREKYYRAYNTRAFGDEWDNCETIKKIVDLRYRKAALLGYKDFADYRTGERMVKNGAAVWDFIGQLSEPAKPVAEEELEELNRYARSKGFDGDRIMPWDFSYWAEKMRVEKYDLSVEEMKPYFRLDDCIDAIFSLANRLYGISFKPIDIPVYHPDVKVYEVSDADGSHLALFYADFFPRASKRSGAWMTEFRGLKIENGVEERPFISLVTNFTKPTADSPSLLTHDEFTTMLHEFGHSLHGIMAKGRYPSQTGTNVDHDFVELPSQIMENWGYEKEFLNTFSRHYKTGEPIPDEMIDKIKASMNYMSAYYHMRQIQFGVLDMSWHTLTVPISTSVIRFEKDVLKETDVLPPVDDCIISTSFSHIFSGGYAAGYYSYKWAEVLAADGFSLFKEKGIFDKKTAGKFRHLLEQGGSVDPAILYRDFRGHDPQPEALLRQLEIIK
ncbi:MAG: M3 family metallopeptidase [Bacteroidaceae bacterium]|nr:M3 family metallopeptidase [Bacteroidaceae bacterium]